MTEIADKARFDRIRYAQAWEDADVLCASMGDVQGKPLLAVCASGDNALALLTLDPSCVVAADLSAAQLSCLRIRMSAMLRLSHSEYLELLGAISSTRRGKLFDRALAGLSEPDARFWDGLGEQAVDHGIGAVGKFENYFRIFRSWVLPLVHSRRTVESVFFPRDPDNRKAFYAREWDTWRWRLLLKVFFSNFTMGILGRDPAFFDHVEGSLSDHVGARVAHAGAVLDPSINPYMSWILRGHPGDRLPLPWREEHYATIRSRLDRIESRHGDLVQAGQGRSFAGFYLSDIFEYMSVSEFEAAYAGLLELAAPSARLVYWNMMVQRSLPDLFAARTKYLEEISRRLGEADNAFFYSAFRVEEVQ